MLYKYKYIRKHTIHRLNQHLLYFYRHIQSTTKNSKFIVTKYFHPEFATDVNNSPVLKEKFKSFFDTFKILSAKQKEDFYGMVLKAQSIDSYFENKLFDVMEIHNTTVSKIIKNKSLSELTNYLFTTTIKLPKWGIADHYKKIYDSLPSHKTCPFCGVGEMHQTFREDYDHLASKKYYSLVTINLKNLVPMCNTCNSKFKGDADVFFLATIRRMFAYPYTTELPITFDYSNSVIPETDITNEKGIWKVNILPNDEMCVAWKSIFKIEKRYVEDYLIPKFEIWISYFIEELIASGIKINSIRKLKTELRKASKRFEKWKFMHSNIIKAPLFDYLANSNNAIFFDSILKMYKLKATAA